MDMAMNAVERVDEYSAIEQEPPAVIPNSRPPPNWPTKGHIKVEKLNIRYTDDTPLVLKDLTFEIKEYEKIGVVGRTGAGKSTLSLAFFRILPIHSGRIILDGVDISKIGLRDLRSRMTIIPQDPVLFEGTLRSNLDPLKNHTDEELWDAVKAVGLLDSMQKPTESAGSSTPSRSNENAATDPSSVIEIKDEPPSKATKEDLVAASTSNASLSLDSEVAEGGINWSMGQRQLICMCRAMLRSTKVFFLDEATASVDAMADTNIQKVIRTSFNDATVITIAHRLKTIIDYDRVLVLDAGRNVEFDTPYNLMTKETGIFKNMCEETGEFSELLEMAAKKKGF
ncbi:hypothetical protein HDV05_006027 [Chytridiales sp. JEL 0842]|nr:hypothetical protein HDV05_006027 [Chytridiales sp. JEL 0842]